MGIVRGQTLRRDRAALERLLKQLKHRGAEERDRAARELGALGDPRAATSLALALCDRSHDVRWSAAAALDKLGDPRARDFYLDALHGNSRANRWAAVSALSRNIDRGDRRALGPLREALVHPDLDVRVAAQALLGAEPF